MKSLSIDRRSEPARAKPFLRARAFASQNVLFVAGISILLVVIFCALFAPILAPHAPTDIVMSERLVPPSLDHPLGTDRFGRDILSRLFFGARTSLLVGICVMALAVAIGAPIGLAAGYFGGPVDGALMRISDVFLAFPPLLLPIAIVAAIGPGLWNAMIALAVSWFPWYARIMRGAVLRVRKELYVEAARTMGVGHMTVMIRHILPNALTPVIVQASMDFGYAILATASLSFIGLGVRPPGIEWGLMAASARADFLEHWWTAAAPGITIFITVLAVNLVGDGLRDMFDPKQRSAW